MAFSCLCQPVWRGENLEVFLTGNNPRYFDPASYPVYEGSVFCYRNPFCHSDPRKKSLLGKNLKKGCKIQTVPKIMTMFLSPSAGRPPFVNSVDISPISLGESTFTGKILLSVQDDKNIYVFVRSFLRKVLLRLGVAAPFLSFGRFSRFIGKIHRSG